MKIYRVQTCPQKSLKNDMTIYNFGNLTYTKTCLRQGYSIKSPPETWPPASTRLANPGRDHRFLAVVDESSPLAPNSVYLLFVMSFAYKYLRVKLLKFYQDLKIKDFSDTTKVYKHTRTYK